ncbi:MAG: tryptophan synthase subunit alpha [Nitrososphaeria archaeon]|jgi:tryptophan synthase alpha chain
MREIGRVFQKLKEERSGALIGYIMCGDPKPEHTPKIAQALVQGGVDILELGLPFSDPIADGPTIQAASVRALKAGTKPRMVLETAKQIKEEHRIPIAILTYYNPIFRMGPDTFFRSARDCGVDGVIVPDLPVEEAHDYRKTAETHEIDTIFLAAPSTSTRRLQKIVKCTSGFLYLVSSLGVTGERMNIQDSTIQLIKKFKPYTAGRIPLAVGFGISTSDHVKAVIENGADGAIVGSAFVNIVRKNQRNSRKMLDEIEEKARDLKTSTKT